jgi:protein-S-isoprenylcysteine O-methyltransferase Ste14
MMIDVHIVYAILIGHLIGDFFLQTDAMAKNKSSSSLALSQHVLVYTATVGTVMLAFLAFARITVSFEAFMLWVVLNGCLHWVTDYFTSRINKKLWAAGDVHNFFVGVGCDQLIHYVCLISSTILFNKLT